MSHNVSGVTRTRCSGQEDFMHRTGHRRPSIGAAFIAALLALALLMAVLVTPVQGGSATTAGLRPGRELLAEYRLPASVLAQYASHQPLVHLRSDAPKRHLTLAETVPWHGPGFQTGEGRNPYNLVLTVIGHAPAAGDVRALWQIGWEYEEANGQRRRYVVPQSDAARSGVAAGSEVRLTAASGPISFRELRHVLPFVGLVQLDNLDIHQVSVQVWSGPAPLDWAPAWSPLAKALALTALGLLAWWSLHSMRPAARLPAQPPYRSSRIAASGVDLAVAEPAPPPAVPPATPARPAAAQPSLPDPPSHMVRVASNLLAVLTQGLVVTTVPDETRPQRNRSRER
jgi:hypothetical protein